MWTAERWREIERIFDGALQIEPAQRVAWVEDACGTDGALRLQVERMLAADGAAGLLDGPALRVDDRDPHAGAVYGAWRLESKIAEGGVGSVYRAHRVDGAFTRPVAVKLLHVGLVSAALRDRFLREPRFLGRLEHPNIARLLDGGTTPDGTPFVVMELVDGEPIDRYCDGRSSTLDERVRLIVKVCSAVDHAHRSLVVHRDLKPKNILVTRDGEPRLVDFGIAALLESHDEEGAFSPLAAYTPEYAAPEQVRGAPAGIASDVWSLGVVIHELLTGRRPYSADRIRAIAENPAGSVIMPSSSAAFAPDAERAVERARARSASVDRIRRRLRGDLDAILARALAPDPRERYANCRELSADLVAWLRREPVSARRLGPVGLLASFVRRHRVSSALSGLLATSLLVGTVVSVRWARIADTRRAAADAARVVAEEQARHASIEARSGAVVANSLTEVFLNERLFPDTNSLERARERLVEEAATLRRLNADDPHLLANLLDGLGRAAMRVALHDLSESLIREALELRTTTFGPSHVERALSLGSLGRLHYQRGEFVPARNALAEAVAIHRAQQGAVHADLALAINDLAAATTGCGDYEVALELHREALSLRRAADPESVYVAESLNNLGSALVRVGRLDEAVAMVAEAIAIRRKSLGSDAILTLQSISNRGVLHLRRGDAAAARVDLEEAAAGFRERHAAGAEGLTATLPKLAHARLLLEDPSGAAEALAEVEPIVRDLFGNDHPRLADVLEQGALIARARLDRAAAANAFSEVLRIREHVFPAGHPSLTTTYHNAGVAFSDAGDHDRALTVLKRCLAAQRSDPGEDAATRVAIGTVLTRAQKYRDAEPWLREALTTLPETAETHRKNARAHLAIVLRNTDRADEAGQYDDS